MLKKTITFNDLDGNPVTEDFYFNLTKAELAKMEMTKAGGMESYLTKIIESNDGGEIIRAFEDILSAAYGRRSEDGKTFLKKPEYWEEFQGTEAYSQLFMEIVTDADASARFMAGLVPADLSASVKKEIEKQVQNVDPLSAQSFGLGEEKDYTKMTPVELAELPHEELPAALEQIKKNQL